MPRVVASSEISAAEAGGPPGIWKSLTQDDHAEYFRLKRQFHQSHRTMGDGHRVAGFHRELLTALSFIERRPEGKEERSVVCGVAFAGPYICVNTRQLKLFLGRCKSSINGSFMEMGYTALRMKSKARTCVLACLRVLIDDVTNLRQWTVRCASKSALFCICSSFTSKERPDIYEGDLIQIHKAVTVRVRPQPRYAAGDVPTAGWFAEPSRESCFDGIDLVPNWELTVDHMLQDDLRTDGETDLLCVFDDFHAE